MRASRRKRSAERGARLARVSRWHAAARRGAFGIVAVLGCAGLMAGTVLASSSVEGRAVAAAQQAAAKAATRVQAQNAAAGVVANAPARGKPAAPAKTVTQARPLTAGKTAAQVRTTVPAKTAAPAKAVAPARTVASARPATRPPAGKTPVGPVQVMAVTASMRPTMTPVPASPSAAHLDDQVTYQYNALGRRDPFMPLVGGRQYVPIEAPPDVGGIQVVGIVWGAEDKFAIIEDGRGNSTVLRPGDKVMNGVVQGLKRDGVVVDLTVDGQTQSVTIPLTRKGDSNENR